MSTTIFNSDKLTDRKLCIRKLIALDYNKDNPDYIYHATIRDMTLQLADTIFKEKTFFKYKSDKDYLTIDVNVFVYTEEEIRQLMKEQFEKGLKHYSTFGFIDKEDYMR